MENASNYSLIGNQSLRVVDIPPAFDYSARVFCLVIHSIYFIIVAISRDLKKMSLIHVHHVNFIGLLSSIHYCIWIAWSQPSTGNELINSVLCSISETVWALCKFARCYAILTLAIYRVVAVFRVNYFKKLVKSIKIYLISCILVWLIPGTSELNK